MRLLLISNSTNAGEAYLAYPMPRIGEFLRGVREVAFVPDPAQELTDTRHGISEVSLPRIGRVGYQQ